jgi:hypothetical protein
MMEAVVSVQSSQSEPSRMEGFSLSGALTSRAWAPTH